MRRLAAALALVLAIACQRQAPVRSSIVRPERKPQSFDTLPPRERYAGSEVCRDCHEKNFGRWQQDWHAHALTKASAQAVAGNFRDAHFRGPSSEAWFERKRSDFIVRTKNREGQIAGYRVEWLIGAKRMQDPVTVMPDGRWQVLPVYTHITGGPRWVDYNEFKQGMIPPDHPYFWTNFRRTANKECIECHATGVDVRYDRATHAWWTSFADAGVACEACHGPGARHAESKAKSDIVRPDRIARDLQLSICARCHGPHEPLFPLLDWRDQLRPGQNYADFYRPLVVTDGFERSGEFFADGRPNSSSFEYQALIQSRCYLRGGATCLSCHTAPHQDHRANEMKKDDVCAQCHKIDAAAHSHHRKATCTDCHMPKIVSGVLDKFPDHTLDIPNPLNTISHNVPNACNACHKNRTANEMQKAIDSWWPDASSKQRRRLTLADAIDEKTAASSRASLEQVIADRHEASSLRGAAAILLAQRFPAHAAFIVPFLGEADSLGRSRFLEALGYANARSASNDIARFLDDSSTHVRQMAALVLSSFHDPRGLTAMRKLANAPSTRKLFRPHIVLAIDAANRGAFEEAQSELMIAIDETPYAADALVMLADIAMRRGDRIAAKSWLEEALRFDPGHRGAKARLEKLGP